MTKLLREKPWLWIVLLLAVLVATDVVFLVIAFRHPVVPAGS
jgi:hypothetical protein